MTKYNINNCYKEMIEHNSISRHMLLECYSLLDKQVSKFAYLKKKYANSGISNECNINDFNVAIKKRNIIASTLKQIYNYSDIQIKAEIKNKETNITRVNCERVLEVINKGTFSLADI